MVCYNCGVEVSNTSNINVSKIETDILKKHVEHVPAKCFYIGSNDEMKRNRITVAACFNCNNGMSGIDDELRNLLGVANDSLIEGQELTEKAVRAIIRKNNWRERIKATPAGDYGAVRFNFNLICKVYMKNFKALVYHVFDYYVSQQYDIHVVFDGFNYNRTIEMFFGVKQDCKEFALAMVSILVDEGVWDESGNKNIFEFGILPFGFDQDKHFVPQTDINRALGILMMQVYHQKIEVLIVAFKKNTFRK